MTNNALFKLLIQRSKDFLRSQFDLGEDPAKESEIIDDIRKGLSVSRTNLWILICAIIIASVGLNTNSAAVIIGAMLISPLMGPIMAIGVGAANNDFALIRDSAKSLLIAATAGIITSTLYFLISPLSEAQSELLARTTPTIYDVFIAFFGGLAGIIAFTRHRKSTNVIAGVAIGTALMPPLCTAGYGLAQGNLAYFFGAGYLFLINCTYICLSTYLVVRLLGFEKRKSTEQMTRLTNRIIASIAVVALLPSIFIAYRLIERQGLERNIKTFVTEEFLKHDVQVLKQKLEKENGKYQLRLLVLGKVRDPNLVAEMEKKLTQYSLTNIDLVLTDATQNVKLPDLAELRTGVLEDIVHKSEKDISNRDEQIAALQKELAALQGERPDNAQLLRELQVQYPQIQDLVLVATTVGEQKQKELLGYLKTASPLPKKTNDKIGLWLQIRTNTAAAHLLTIAN